MIYDDTQTIIFGGLMDALGNLYYVQQNGALRKFTILNTFENLTVGASSGAAIDSQNNIFALIGIIPYAATTNINIYYVKNDANTFHRAVRPYFQIGAVISNNALSTMGIYTVIPYSRQRLTEAYHLVIRTDGAIYMEVI
jgi:hypothetical protein